MAKTPTKEDAPAKEEADLKRSQDGKKDPAGKAVDPEKAEPTDIPANEPYPTGKGRDPEEDFKAAHGFSRKE